jgi:DNA-directed RNA polymerase specialized sigma24 family protein
MDDLIARWAAGEEAAAEELYRTYFERVSEFLRRRGIRSQDAEDLAQEAMIAGLDGLKSGKQPDHLTVLILDNELDPEDPAQRSARSVVIRREMKDLLDRTLESLTPKERDIIDLFRRADLTQKEIADRLEIPADAVHGRFQRARQRLREALSRHFTTIVASRMERPPVTLADLQALRPGFRSAVTAVHLEELSLDQAALKLGVPHATLRARLRSAYETLGYDEAPDFSKAREEHRGSKRP